MKLWARQRSLARRLACAILAAFLSGSPSGHAAGKVVEPLSAQLLLKRETVLRAELSVDGAWLAMIVTRVGPGAHAAAGKNITTNTLQVMHVASGRILGLASASSMTSTFAWAPDGMTLAFDTQQGERHDLWLWRTTEQRPSQVPGVHLQPGPLSWSADGRAVVAAVAPEPEPEQSTRPSQTTPAARVRVYRSVQASYDYSSNDRLRAELARIDVSDGTVRWIAKGMRPQAARSSPDGRWIAFWTLTGQLQGNGYRNSFDLIVAPADGQGAPRTLASNVESISTVMNLSWSPDSSTLAYVSARWSRGHGLLEGTGECFLVRLNDAPPRRVELVHSDQGQVFLAATNRAPLWSASGDALLLIGSGGLWRVDVPHARAAPLARLPGKDMRQIIAPQRQAWIGRWAASNHVLILTRDRESGQQGIARVHLSSGRVQPLIEMPADFDASSAKLDVRADGAQFIYLQESAALTQQLWLGDSALRTPRQLTRLNPELDRHALGSSRLISWHGAGGRLLQGALFLPAGYEVGTRYPLIVEVSGDDKLSQSVNRFGGWGGFATPLHNTQFLTTRGFAVLAADASVSPATRLSDLAASVLPGVDRVIELGIADSQRVGIKGQSAGGYAALALLVQTGRFKAAVVSAGFADLGGLYGQMHADGMHWTMSWLESQDGMAATPWEDRDRYITNSPYFLLDRLTTPLLLIHGARDTAIDARCADQIFVALRRLGREVEYARYEDEGHLILDPAAATDAAERMLRWFTSHLDPGSNDHDGSK